MSLLSPYWTTRDQPSFENTKFHQTFGFTHLKHTHKKRLYDKGWKGEVE